VNRILLPSPPLVGYPPPPFLLTPSTNTNGLILWWATPQQRSKERQ
jgi:hypothetical protein